jgi:hypothetical protein
MKHSWMMVLDDPKGTGNATWRCPRCGAVTAAPSDEGDPDAFYAEEGYYLPEDNEDTEVSEVLPNCEAELVRTTALQVTRKN